jgi:uncharacterized cupin superfamily protein
LFGLVTAGRIGLIEVFNIFDGELEDARERPAGYRWRAAMVGRRIGGKRLGASIYELEPGEKTFPYHYEYGAEEWLLVVAGRPTLRSPGGEQELRAGDVVCFPEGPDGAHQVRNASDEPARVMILSTKETPAVAVYPDSDKIGIWPTATSSDDAVLVRRSDAVDYWDGEA